MYRRYGKHQVPHSYHHNEYTYMCIAQLPIFYEVFIDTIMLSNLKMDLFKSDILRWSKFNEFLKFECIKMSRIIFYCWNTIDLIGKTVSLKNKTSFNLLKLMNWL